MGGTKELVTSSRKIVLSWLNLIVKLKLKESKKEGKYQESIQLSTTVVKLSLSHWYPWSGVVTTPDPGYQWESDNFIIGHHKREPRGQPFLSR